MINQIIPIVEFGVKNDPSGEFLTVPVGDFPACFINFFDDAGENLETGFGHSFCRPFAGIRHRNQRCYLFFCNVYWRFLLYIRNVLFFNYKYTKKSPVICCLTTK